MKEVKKSKLITVMFVLILGYLASRGFYGAIWLENLLLVFFFGVVLFTAIKVLSAIYNVYFKSN